MEQRLDFMCWESFSVEAQGEEWRKGRVLSFTADMRPRAARLAMPGAGDEDGASKQALPAPDQAVGEVRMLYQGNTLVAWVKNMAVRCAGAGTGLA